MQYFKTNICWNYSLINDGVFFICNKTKVASLFYIKYFESDFDKFVIYCPVTLYKEN